VVQFYTFLTSTLDGGERPASRPDCFTPGKRNRVDFRDRLNAVVNRKIIFTGPTGKLNLIVKPAA